MWVCTKCHVIISRWQKYGNTIEKCKKRGRQSEMSISYGRPPCYNFNHVIKNTDTSAGPRSQVFVTHTHDLITVSCGEYWTSANYCRVNIYSSKIDGIFLCLSVVFHVLCASPISSLDNLDLPWSSWLGLDLRWFDGWCDSFSGQ